MCVWFRLIWCQRYKTFLWKNKLECLSPVIIFKLVYSFAVTNSKSELLCVLSNIRLVFKNDLTGSKQLMLSVTIMCIDNQIHKIGRAHV